MTQKQCVSPLTLTHPTNVTELLVPGGGGHVPRLMIEYHFRGKSRLAVFFQAQDGCSYPVSRIVRILPVKDHVATVELTGDQSVKADDFHIDQMMRQIVSSFAALPDTYVIDTMMDDPDDLYKSAVVGWCITADGSVRPVTALGVNDGDPDLAAVLMPDGKVSEYGLFDSLEDWKKSKKKD